MESPAIDAVMEHDPLPAVTVTTPTELTEQAEDAPADHVTDPALDPPDVPSEMVPPYTSLEPPVIERAA